MGHMRLVVVLQRIMIVMVLFLMVKVEMMRLMVLMVLFVMDRHMDWNRDRDWDGHWHLLWLSGSDDDVARLFGELPTTCQLNY
jgi:hypothetical protein